MQFTAAPQNKNKTKKVETFNN